MTNRVKAAFSAIRVEDSLKEATLRRLHEKVQRKAKPRRYFAAKRLAVAAVCFVLVLFSGLFSYNLYFTETAYIDLDINPSLALAINRFDRVIGAEAHNEDGTALLAGLSLRYKKVKAAVDEIVAAAAETGALQQERLVTVTVQAGAGDEALLARIESDVAASVSHHGAEADVFPVDSATRSAAHENHISPAKYLAILALQEVDPTTPHHNHRRLQRPQHWGNSADDSGAWPRVPGGKRCRHRWR